MTFLNRCQHECRKHPRKIIFADGMDVRVLRTARRIADENLGFPVIIGNQTLITGLAERNRVSTRRIQIVPPGRRYEREKIMEKLKPALNYDRKMILTVEDKLNDPLSFGILMAETSQRDICFAGNLSTQEEMIDKLLQSGRFMKKAGIISGLSVVFDRENGRPVFFSDCAVIPRPDAEQLAKIAIDTVESFKAGIDEEPRVSLLSFSTAGSAQHPLVDTIQKAKVLIKAMNPELCVEGEIQFDAAWLPEIGLKKNPQSLLKEPANIFIFPSLNAGYTALKIARYLCGCKALGPFIQGRTGAAHCFSFDMTEEEMYETILIGAVMRKNERIIPN
ncbi:MAG: hypothetical protein JXR46_09810 [Calditrichaceae bacterium]|nr:hypothetical protein [Calditrichaceae bacterium]MBN2709329.1 hypothetical protein [Calditrichaceae bacterium]